VISRNVVTLLLIATLISGCASGGFRYIYPTKEDAKVVSQKLKRQIVEHNEHCDWMKACK
jgi:hypothetical protein